MKFTRTLATTAVLAVLAFCCPSLLPEPGPMRMAVCEGISLNGLWFCGGVWTFNGNSGKAQWPNDATADLTLERLANEQITIRRTDTGKSQGMTAVYTGKRKGHRIEGEAVYTWPAQWTEPQHGTFSATIDDASAAALSPPSNFRGPFPDVNGIWHLKPESTGGRDSGISVAIFQSGADVSMVLVVGDQARSFSYRGHFESSTLVAGQSCNSSFDKDHPRCVPESSPTTILSPTQMRDNDGALFDKVAGRDDPRYAKAALLLPPKNIAPYLPDQPFDLTGTWIGALPGGPAARIQIKQNHGLIDMWGPFGGYPFFTGWYLHNPVVGGTALSRAAKGTDVRWTPATLFLESPDVLQMTSEGNIAKLSRLTPPADHDVSCDAKNQFHIDPFHALMRGRAALNGTDFTAARCWLSLSANAGYAPGQSLYAAFLIRATPPDYDLAFEMAVNSAKQGDIGGQLMLADLFREGKGTAPDPVKAKYWQDQAERSKEMKLWRQFNTPVFFGMSAMDLAELTIKVTNSILDDDNQRAARWNCMMKHPGGYCP